ncbi:limbic system-associated membrane protein precursor [Triplophysa rosa]|uniref:Limbic system-associated membrane protein n=1 Tax=Triplophysa rosa TaxID=992332 RepID=A0A9W7TP09_TRIRA|nr:limbic system-associated membrane protein precursor [Triplophysa rosa]
MNMVRSISVFRRWLYKTFLCPVSLSYTPTPHQDPCVQQTSGVLYCLPIRCYVDDKVSKVAWLNRSNIIFAGEDKWSLDPRVELVTQGQLEYSLRIQKVDVFDEGPYTCSIQTKQQPKTSQVYLIVQVPANIYKVSEDITVNEGSNVTLTCLANGRPDPAITWRLLNPSDPPYIKAVRSSETPVGHAGILHCEASAVPQPEFEWYRDDRRLSSSQSVNIQITGSRTLLVVANVTEDDYGNYTCVATNRLGIHNASLFLYKPGTGRDISGSDCMCQSLGLLLLSVLFALLKC